MSVTRRYGRRVVDAISTALIWWATGLWWGLPPGLRALFRPRDRLLIEMNQTEFTIRRNDDDDKVVVDFASDRGPEELDWKTPPHPKADVVLVLPLQRCLQKSFVLPLAGERELRRLLYFELDRLTPFPLDAVAYAHHLTDRDKDAGTITVHVVLAPRSVLVDANAQLSMLGIVPTVATVVGQNGTTLPINLLTDRSHSRLPFTGVTFHPAPVAIALAAFALALFLPLPRYQTLLNEHAVATAQLRSEANEAQAAAEAAAAQLEPLRYLDEQQSEYVSPLDLLLELTMQIPDHTWLSRLSIGRGQAQLQGETATASAVLELVESIEGLQNAEFQAPVSRSQSGKEQFTITASLRRPDQ